MKKYCAAFALLLVLPAMPVAAREAAGQQAADPHFLTIEGGHNIRDAGGYRTVDGHMVRRGIFYRSASLARLTPLGMGQMKALRIAAIIDLRSTAERRADTNNWLSMSGQGYWTRDYSLDDSGFAALFGEPASLTPERVRTAMAEGYRSMPTILAPSYRELFGRLIGGRGAVLVNCTAGKDRTGLATALVLSALGVPYETVREEFLLTNVAPRQAWSPGSAGHDALAGLPHAVLAPLAGVEGPYLDAAFDQIRRDYGSVEGYLERELGIGPKELQLLRRRMLI